MIRKAFFVFCILGWLAGCTHGPSGDSLLVTEGKALTRLQLIDGQSFHSNAVALPRLPELEADKEDQIRRYCQGPDKAPDQAFIPLTFLIGPAIDFVLDYIDKALEQELKQYIAAYSATVEEKFYKSTAPNGPTSAWTCFRFSRAINQEGQDRLVMDLIGQLAITDEKDAIKVRPLRMYFAQAKAKGEQYGITLSLKAHSVWRQHNKGQSEQIFEHLFLSDKFDISNSRPAVKYYLDSEWDTHPRLSLIPWSTNQEGNMKTGDVTFTLTVAEVGTPPVLLEHAAKLFTKNKGDLAKLMKESVEKLFPNQKDK